MHKTRREEWVNSPVCKIKASTLRLSQKDLIFLKKLWSSLKEQDFVLNPYDPCVVNKMDNSTQLTIVRYVDNFRISCMKSSVVTMTIK